MAVHRVTTPAGELHGSALASTLEAACERWSERPAIAHQGCSITYRQLGERVSALAGAYREMGIRSGDVVLCQLRNCPEHVLAMNAAWACGAIHAGTDNDLTGRELAALVERTGAAALVFQPRSGVADPLEPLRAVRAASPTTKLILHGEATEGEHDFTLAELFTALAPANTSIRPPFAPDDTAVLLLTSGTTGPPKAVRESLPHCWAKMQFFADAFCPGPDDVHLLYLPMAHVFGLRLSLIPLLTGGRLVLLDRFSPEAVLNVVDQERVTVLPGMPTHFTLLLGQLDHGRHLVNSLRWGISAAAGLPPPLVEAIYDELGVDLLFVYGCSEGFTTLTTDREEISRGSVGRTVFRGPEGTAPNGIVTVVDPSDRTPLPTGEVGELAFGASGPVRYWDEPDVATDGWYYTGDLGRVDPDGSVFVLGRLKELVNRGGLKVSASEIENAMARHPAVVDGAVIASPDPVLGEAICACIVPAELAPPSLADLRAFLAPTLARHKLPDEACVVPGIPRTSIGKVDRAALTVLATEPGRRRERLRP